MLGSPLWLTTSFGEYWHTLTFSASGFSSREIRWKSWVCLCRPWTIVKRHHDSRRQIAVWFHRLVGVAGLLSNGFWRDFVFRGIPRWILPMTYESNYIYFHKQHGGQKFQCDKILALRQPLEYQSCSRWFLELTTLSLFGFHVETLGHR